MCIGEEGEDEEEDKLLGRHGPLEPKLVHSGLDGKKGGGEGRSVSGGQDRTYCRVSMTVRKVYTPLHSCSSTGW